MTLRDLIGRLEKADPARVVPRGFARPHSYRGYYHDLAFEPTGPITVGEMLAAAKSALGETYQGWKGGDYEMSEQSDCWISVEGEVSGETVGDLLLDYLLGQENEGKSALYDDAEPFYEPPPAPADPRQHAYKALLYAAFFCQFGASQMELRGVLQGGTWPMLAKQVDALGQQKKGEAYAILKADGDGWENGAATRLSNEAMRELEDWAAKFGVPLPKMSPEREKALRDTAQCLKGSETNQ